MLDKDLELTLNTAFKEAREQRHEFMTVEHLLLALLDNPSATKVLRSCGANLNALHSDLIKFIQENSPLLSDDDERDTQPTLGFQRVLQRAVFHVQSSGSKEVTGANVLVAIFAERESHAAYFLSQQDITRLDIVNYISHGIAKVPEDDQSEIYDTPTDDETHTDEPSANPLEAFAINPNQHAELGTIDPLIRRQTEMERTIQNLCR
ncbi:MAG: Clp protease N-terminal domain-containing protein, partial [Gammaproteobacteria bacterium]